jgi:pimeloyl-ACP methyl ester carboxylesterase
MTTKPVTTASLGENFEEQMNQFEAIAHPTPGTEKKIIWARPNKVKTATSFVYLHGWSASRQEISPTVERVAKKLEANAFFTRLTGHGLGPEGFRQITTEKLLSDAEEALQVGQKIGEKVVLVGMSTGASLSLYLAHQHPESVAALVLISPNFRPRRLDSLLLRGPLGPLFSWFVMGNEYQFIPVNELNAKFWTTKYPSRALSTMMSLVDGVARQGLRDITIPTLFIYSENDQVVSVDLIKENFNKLGSPNKKIIEISSAPHVLAGDILSPSTTEKVVEEMQIFLNQALH